MAWWRRLACWGMSRREGPGTRSRGRWHYSDGDIEVPADVVLRKDPYAQRPTRREQGGPSDS